MSCYSIEMQKRGLVNQERNFGWKAVMGSVCHHQFRKRCTHQANDVGIASSEKEGRGPGTTTLATENETEFDARWFGSKQRTMEKRRRDSRLIWRSGFVPQFNRLVLVLQSFAGCSDLVIDRGGLSLGGLPLEDAPPPDTTLASSSSTVC